MVGGSNVGTERTEKMDRCYRARVCSAFLPSSLTRSETGESIVHTFVRTIISSALVEILVFHSCAIATSLPMTRTLLHSGRGRYARLQCLKIKRGEGKGNRKEKRFAGESITSRK